MVLGRTESRACGPRCRACAALRAAAPEAVALRGIRSVTLEDFAAVAGLRGADVEVHARGDVHGLLGSAYLVHAGRLQSRFRDAFLAAPTPRHGLEAAVLELLGAVAEDGARTRFCYLEIELGTPALRALRSQIARGSAALWAEAHRGTAADSVPATHFEVVNGAVVRLIADHATHDRVEALPARADTVFALLGSAPHLP
jgi:hypothetical protein